MRDRSSASAGETVAIVGAGLCGCLLACFLARRGLPVALYERRPDPRRGTVERGRSINLAISERGLDALRRIGLETTVMADAIPMRGRMIHPVEGPLDFQRYSADGLRAINSISRGDLNNALLDAVDALPGVTVSFEHRLTSLDPSSDALAFDTPSGTVAIEASVVLGTDGAGSAVRTLLAEQGRIDATSDLLEYGYKELGIPAQAGEFALDPHALHIWPRGTSMAIALPNPDRSFTATLFWPQQGPDSFAALPDPISIRRYFGDRYPDLVLLAPDLVDDFVENPVGVLGTVHTSPWQVTTGDGRGHIAVLGDAAHAIVPFYGQGANCAFEDVVALDRCLDDSDGIWGRALPLFEHRRRRHADAIADMALANFVEMRDKVSSPVFKARKRIDHGLERLLPGWYVSQYELVSFSTVPYDDVRRRVRRQQLAVGGLAAATLAAGASVVARA